MPESVFKGQILTVSIVITFLAVFLLREWIFQNAGPGPNQEVENGRVPRPEEFRANMRAVWRRRQLRNVDQEEPARLKLDPADIQILPLNNGVLDQMEDQGPQRDLDGNVNEPVHEHDDEDDQWVDEEWHEEDGFPQDRSSERVAGEGREEYIIEPREEFSGASFHETPVTDAAERIMQEQGPAPSLLQQLRRQHRDLGDPNMSFEEFLLYQRHNMLELPNGGQASTENAVILDALPPRHQTEQVNDQFPEEQMREAYMRLFREPTDEEESPRDLMLDIPLVPEYRRDEQRTRREEQLRRAAQVAEIENFEPDFDALPQPRRLEPPRDHALDAAAGPLAEAEGGEVVEMGPEPGFNEDDIDDEGGLIIDGDLDGILEGAPAQFPAQIAQWLTWQRPSYRTARSNRWSLPECKRNPQPTLCDKRSLIYVLVSSQFLLISIVLNCGICVLVNVPFIIGKVHLLVSIACDRIEYHGLTLRTSYRRISTSSADFSDFPS